ncbi:MAG: hypothetical protein ACLRL4_04560 [Bifidobacterium bifidum]
MTTVIRNQGTSLAVREKLAADGRPVLLAFSCGKDSIAAWLAMRDMGIEVVPAYLYYVPGLRFVDEELDYFEQKFQTRIKRYPHPSLYRWLNNAVFQAPERLRYIEAARLPEPSYEQMWDFIRADVGLDKSTWCADGVRAADSIQRRGAFVQYGYWRRNLKKVSPIGDWLKGEVLDCISGHHIELPCDYAWFGRSFDGIDKRFTKVLKDKAPDDYATLLEWFPCWRWIMSGDFRFDFSKKSKGKKAVKPVPENLDENAKEYRERARAERKRFVDATDTEFWLCLCSPPRRDGAVA